MNNEGAQIINEEAEGMGRRKGSCFSIFCNLGTCSELRAILL